MLLSSNENISVSKCRLRMEKNRSKEIQNSSFEINDLLFYKHLTFDLDIIEL